MEPPRGAWRMWRHGEHGSLENKERRGKLEVDVGGRLPCPCSSVFFGFFARQSVGDTNFT
jgi:hypothetical protein